VSRVVLHHGDNRDHLRRLIAAGVRVQSVVTDGPYGLVSINKRFGKEGAAAAKHGTDGAFGRISGGFMGSKWDATGIERDPEFWRLIFEILVPGGYCLAFSSPRTGHWQACAMETAGFVMHPFIGWVYGQGLPKDCDAQRAIDCHLCELPGRHYEAALPRENRRPDDHVCPPSAEGEAWAGWSYGTQSMKPALEPIYVGQRPFAEKNGALNMLRHGAGPINIDACRVPVSDAGYARNCSGDRGHGGTRAADAIGSTNMRTGGGSASSGRHPANLIHDGSTLIESLFPSTPGQLARSSSSSSTRKNQNCYGEMRRGSPGSEMTPRGDSGSAARFFNAAPFTEEDYDALTAEGYVIDLESRTIYYNPKATKADRAGSKHPTVKPISLLRLLVRLVTPPGGTVLDPFAGSGTTGQAAMDEGFACILMEGEDKYAADIRRRFSLPFPGPTLPADMLSLLGIEAPANDDVDVEALLG
jgi:site-specific DNA-methyltransferase (adenine-specific)